MPQSQTAQDRTILDILAPQFEADGFLVFIHPQKNELPPFLQDLQPDMVAYRPDKYLAIEVTPRRAGENRQVEKLRARLADNPPWELRLVYAPRANANPDFPVVAKQAIADRLETIAASMEIMGPTGALLTGWSVFEAAARALLPARFARPQPPAHLIETLASAGYVTPDEADMLRALGRTRNEVAHGRLDLTPSPSDVTHLLDVTRALLTSEADADHAGPDAPG